MAPRVAGSTRVYAVLGHPISHSLSPRMQNAAFEASDLDSICVALDVAPEDLGLAFRGLHAAGFRGMSVTLPLKELAWKFAAERTETAERAGAVNALVRTEAGYRGHATDGPGFAAWLQELGIRISGRRVLLLGAGGAARSLVPAMVAAGVGAFCVVSRSAARAASLAASAPAALTPRSATLTEVPRAPLAGPWDLLVRALSSEALADGEEAWWGTLSADAPVLDLNYGARCAAVRARAAASGRRYEGGLGLLLHQGALAFEFWTGMPAPLAAMRSALGDP